MKWINRLYIIFVGIILSLTVGFGVSAFYPEPRRPYYPVEKPIAVPSTCYDKTVNTTSPECEKLIKRERDNQVKFESERLKLQDQERLYQNKSGAYTRTAIFLGVTIGALLSIGGLLLIKKSKLVASGLMLGGVLTAIFTRVLINLASLGAYTGTTETSNTLAFVEFSILVVLSLAVLFVGFFTLKEE